MKHIERMEADRLDKDRWRHIVVARLPQGVKAADVVSHLESKPVHIGVIAPFADQPCAEFIFASCVPHTGHRATEERAQFQWDRALEIDAAIEALTTADSAPSFAETIQTAEDRAAFYATTLLVRVAEEMDFHKKQSALYTELEERLTAALRECFDSRGFDAAEPAAAKLRRNTHTIAAQTIIPLRHGVPPRYKLR